MDMSLREWLILIGAVILVGILLDGYRRMLRAKKDSLEISQRMGGTYDSTPLEDDFNPELPGGRARIVRREDGTPIDETENLDAGQVATDTTLRGQRSEPDFGWDDEADDLVAERDLHAADQARDEAVLGGSTQAREKLVTPEPSARHQPAKGDQPASAARFPEAVIVSEEAVPASAPKPMKADQAGPAKVAEPAAGSKISLRRNKPDPTAKPSAKKPPQEIIIINVLSREEDGFSGLQLRRLAEACGLEYGEMSVFNRHEHGFGQGPVQFGMASLTDPGTFDLSSMDDSRFPGVCFFLSLPGPDDTMKAFEYMLETAQCVVRNLHGEMKDERRSVFTQQTIEHCRQRVREFERRQQLAARV